LQEEVESIEINYLSLPPQQKGNFISDFRLRAFLSVSVNMTYRVLLFQSGEIYSHTLLIPENWQGNLFLRKGGVSGPLKNKNYRNVEYLKRLSQEMDFAYYMHG
jgi:hypothetical protein